MTEFNFNDQDLSTTEAFFNTSIEYLDNLASIGRYSFFGAFRSSVSNVGPNAAMLSRGGELTDIGVWYLGEDGKGVAPDSDASSPGVRLWNQGTLARTLVACWFTSITLLVAA